MVYEVASLLITDEERAILEGGRRTRSGRTQTYFSESGRPTPTPPEKYASDHGEPESTDSEEEHLRTAAYHSGPKYKVRGRVHRDRMMRVALEPPTSGEDEGENTESPVSDQGEEAYGFPDVNDHEQDREISTGTQASDEHQGSPIAPEGHGDLSEETCNEPSGSTSVSEDLDTTSGEEDGLFTDSEKGLDQRACNKVRNQHVTRIETTWHHGGIRIRER